MRSITIFISVGLCLSVCPLACPKNDMSKLREIVRIHVRYLLPWLGPPLTTVQYNIDFRFFRTTSSFHTMVRQVAPGRSLLATTALLEVRTVYFAKNRTQKIPVYVSGD